MGYQLPVAGVGGQNFGAGTAMFETASPLITSERVKKSFSYQIQRLMPNGAAPLFGLMSMTKEAKAVQIEHGFFAKIQLFPTVTTNGAISDGTTTAFTVVSSAQMVPGMLLMFGNAANPQIELLLVSAIVSGTAITVVRNIGSLGSVVGSNVDPIAVNTSIPTASVLFAIGNAQGEGSQRPASFLTQAIRVTNYTQIFRNTWAVTDTIRATEMLVGESSVVEARQECAMYHAIGIESAIIFSRLSTGNASWNSQTGTLPFRTMNGVVASVEQETLYPVGTNAGNTVTASGLSGQLGTPARNYFSCASIAGPNPSGSTVGTTSSTAGQINWTDLQFYLEQTLNQTTDPRGSNDRIVLVGGGFLTMLMNLVRYNGLYWIDGQVTEWGLQFRTLKTARGTFRIIEHPLFNATNSNLSYAALILDLPSLSLAYLGDRKQKTEEFNMNGDKTSELGIDAIGGTLTSECTIEVRNPVACGFIANAKTPVTG